MTRTLPWLKRPNTATPKAECSPQKSAPRVKRRKLLEPNSDVDDENGDIERRERAPNGRASPPLVLEPPLQSLMNEGLDKDDRFRMVEDEFLDAAKQFTQHFHAAEYQRLKKAAKAQNAAAIKSISRPVTVKMPDETRRKVESVARAKKQAAAVQSILGKQGRGSGSDEESDSTGGAWLGTALHGLMESTRRSANSLSKVEKITVSTRAAAGFNKPHPQSSSKGSLPSPPQLESFRLPNEKVEPRNRIPNESSTDDDDLDAPVRLRVQPRSDEVKKVTVRPSPNFSQRDSKSLLSKTTTDVTVKASSSALLEDGIGTSSHTSIHARERIAKRLEQAKRRQIREDQDPRKEVEIIPMFLS